MPISGILVKVEPEKAQGVLKKLQTINNVTTYGIHKENNIIIVIEGKSVEEINSIITHIQDNIEAVIGVFPAYINFEDIVEENNQ